MVKKEETSVEGIDLEQEQREIINAYRGLLRASKDSRNKEETRLIKKAFNVALDAHSGDRRKSDLTLFSSK